MSVRQFSQDLSIKLGRRFNVDTTFYSKIVGWFGISYISAILRGLGTTFLLARWLPAETFGAFRYIIAMYGIAGIFSFSSYHSGIIRGIAAGDTEVAWVGTRQMVRNSFIGSLVLFGAGLERLWHAESTVGAGLIISSLFFPFLSAGSLYGSILTGKGEIKTLSLYNTANNLVFILIFLLTLVFYKKNLIVICLAFFGIDVVLKLIMSIYQLIKLPRHGSADQHIQLGSHLSFMGMFQAFAFQIDQIIIQRLFGYTSLANYSIATLIPDQIVDFIKSFSGIFLQRKALYHSKHNIDDRKAVRRQMMYFLLFMFLMWVGYAISAPLFIPLLFPKYASQVIPTIIYSLGILGAATGIGLSWMQARHQLKALWRFSLINSVLQSVSTITLTIWLGGLGAILAKTLTRLTSTPFAFPGREIEKAPHDRTHGGGA